MKLFQIIVICIVVLGCNNTDNADLSSSAKKQILAAEEAFAKAVKEKGEKAAFLEFADDSAVIKRGSQVYNGKNGITGYFNEQTYTNASLEWEPEYVYVSSSGDLGYTYGKFRFSATDSSKIKIEFAGIFHTVWKKQSNGDWKYVFD